MLRAQIKSKLARNTLWMSLGQGLRLLVQAAYFTIIARTLGTNHYGSFVGVVALVGIVYPFGALGSGHLLVRSIARNKAEFQTAWGEALMTTAICSTLLIAFVLLISRVLLPGAIPANLVLMVAIADIPGLSLITIAGQAFQSFEQIKWLALITLLISVSRLLGAVVLIVLHSHPTALEWGHVYLICTAVTAMISTATTCFRLGSPRLRLRRSIGALWHGFHFSVTLSAQTIYNDIDKTMLARLSTLSATGIYGAAYRIIDVSFSPVLALLYSAYPNFFRTGSTGINSSFSYAKPLMGRAMVYAALIACALLLCAGGVPYVLGPEYADTTVALRWLSPLPLLKATHYFLADSLTGAGHQGLRSGIQAGVALFNIFVNLWLIPRYSWKGAAWSSIVSDALLAISVGAAVYVLSRHAHGLVRAEP